MTISSDVLQGLMVAALLGKTGAGDAVYAPRSWPTVVPQTPILLVQSPTERKDGLGRSGAPQFTCTTTIRVVGRISAKAAGLDAAAVAVLASLGVLQRQIEVAVINDYELRRVIQQFKSVEVTSDVSRESEVPVGELVMDFSLEFYQGPEDFAPNPVSPIEEFALFADLVNIYSPSDSFGETPFADAANPAPRTAGPDGRAEGVFHLFLQAQDVDFSISANSGLLPGI